MNNDQQVQHPTVAPQNVEDGFNLQDFGKLVFAHWYWMVISVALALCVAVVVILRSTPTYTRSMSMLVKAESKGGSSGSLPAELQSLGLEAPMTNINNEILTLQAPVLMQEAVKRLHLDVQMSVKQGLHSVPLYDNSPVTLLLPQMDEEATCSFKMKLKENRTAELYDFATSKAGQTVEDSKHLTVRMGTLAATPVGTVIIQPTKDWGVHRVTDEILVQKLPVATVAASYVGRLGVTLSNKETTILNLSLSDESTQRADNLLLKLVEVYNEKWLKDRNLVAESTYEFITERLNTLSVELGDVEQQISDFKSANLLPDAESASSLYMNESTKSADQVFALNNQLSMARFIREYLNDRSKASQYLPSNSGIGSIGIEQLISEYNKQLGELNELLLNSSAETPLVKKLTDDLEAKRQTILVSLDNLIAQLQKQVGLWQQNEKKNNSKLAEAPQHAQQLLSVTRQQKVKEQLYIYLLQKREESELGKTFSAWNTRIIQLPSGGGPASPKKEMILLIAFVVGICLPLAYLYLREMMDKTVRGRADLDNLLIPLISEIPGMVRKRHWWNRTKKDVPRKVYIRENCRDLINESFRILRTKLDYFLHSCGEGNKVIMLTSLNPNSGKSFISLNLAKVLSLKGKRVLSVDMDFRHCSLSSSFGSPKQGLTDYLGRMTDNVDSLILKDAIGEGGDVLPVGIIPPNPTEMLLSDRLLPIFEKLRGDYDYIILDCPPIDVVADTNIVKQLADVSLFVIRAGLMDRRSLKDVEKLYLTQSYKHMALLLNGSTYVSSRYGNYRYGYAYGYNYGYNYGSNYDE